MTISSLNSFNFIFGIKKISLPVITSFTFFSIFPFLHLAAQKQIIHQGQIWYGYNSALKFNDKSNLKTDIEERQFFSPVGAQSNLLFRSVYYHSLGNNWEAGAGLAVALNSPQKIPTTSTLVVPEIRPTIDFVYRQKIGSVNLNHRYRFEARYNHNNLNNVLVDGYSFSNYRFRYRLSSDIPLIKNDQKKPVLSVRVYDELFLNFGKKIVSNTFDQNRIYGGVIYEASKSFSFELGYLNWFQETGDGKTYYNRDIIRIGVNHRINLKPSTQKSIK